AAGVSRGLPAYFFGSKETLYRAAMEHAVQLVRSGVIERSEERLRSLRPADFAAAFIDTYIQILAPHPLQGLLLQWDLLQPIRNRRQPALQALFQEGVELVRKGFGGRRRRQGNARLELMSIIGMCLIPFLFAHDRPVDRRFLRQYKRHVIGRLSLAGETKKRRRSQAA